MPSQQSFLYITNGLRDETVGLREMYELLGDRIGSLTLLAATPNIPKGIQGYVEDFDQKITAKAKAEHEAAAPRKSAGEVRYEVLHSDQPFLAIIQQILKGDYDGVVKAAEPTNRDSGYDALDMSLLRKCPAPLWLLKPDADHSGEITAAIDPSLTGDSARDLSLALLREADAIASNQSAPVQVVACWTSPLGDARGNPFLNIQPEEIERESREIRDEHHTTLTKLINDSGLQSKCEIVQVNGDAASGIPGYTKKTLSRLLVMGTVARTGIPGFIMGNTAENIFRELSCSIVAVKPPGWVCPIKPA